MPIRPVLQLGDPRLRRVSEPVADPSGSEIAELLVDLQDTLAHWRATTTYGRGIAAPQIGAMQRVVFMNIDHPWPLVNPRIVAASEERYTVWDACLSFLCIFFQVSRHVWVDVEYQDTTGAFHRVRATGDLSELLQHEIDHLDGVLALDRMTDIRTMCTREEFERRFRQDSPYDMRA